MTNFFVELKRRKVYRVAAAYVVVFPFFEIPNWGVRLVILGLVLGFPAALILSWAYDITPAGIKRTEDRPAEVLPSRLPPHRPWHRRQQPVQPPPGDEALADAGRAVDQRDRVAPGERAGDGGAGRLVRRGREVRPRVHRRTERAAGHPEV